MTNILQQLLDELNSGRLRIVDLTSPLEPTTPVIDLPPIFAPSPGVTLTEISHYDSRGPAWYWNVINMGEHTGTHFDAPIHWVTGKDLPNNATDTILPAKFIDPPFPNHTFMHGAGKFGITSLMNLDLLPMTGAIVIAAPLKIVNGSGSPLRVIAITP